MKLDIVNLENKKVGDLQLDDAHFSVEYSPELIHQVMLYQQAKKQAGTHKVKNISEVSGTGKKPHSQKGTGRARLGSNRVVQARGGAVAMGPVPRSHAIQLNKKVRKKALLSLLSKKLKDKKFIVIDALEMPAPKTKELAEKVKNFSFEKVLFVDGENMDQNFCLSARNLKHVACLPEKGLNVFDILKYDTICFSQKGIEQFTARI